MQNCLVSTWLLPKMESGFKFVQDTGQGREAGIPGMGITQVNISPRLLSFGYHRDEEKEDQAVKDK